MIMLNSCYLSNFRLNSIEDNWEFGKEAISRAEIILSVLKIAFSNFLLSVLTALIISKSLQRTQQERSGSSPNPYNYLEFSIYSTKGFILPFRYLGAFLSLL